MSIQIFITGGTFDKEYNEISGKLYFKKTHLKDMLVMGRSQLDVKIKTLMMIDASISFLGRHKPIALPLILE